MKIEILGLSVLASLIVSCNSTSSIKATSEQLVNTNGVYIAVNDNVTSYREIGESKVPLKSIKVIRFINQENGIIIPESLTDSELLDSVRIRTLYNWCLDFENKNPTDKEYVHFKSHFDGDSIRFSQKAPDHEVVYFGINNKDSIEVAYKTIREGQLPINLKRKNLKFKFYKLN